MYVYMHKYGHKSKIKLERLNSLKVYVLICLKTTYTTYVCTYIHTYLNVHI